MSDKNALLGQMGTEFKTWEAQLESYNKIYLTLNNASQAGVKAKFLTQLKRLLSLQHKALAYYNKLKAADELHWHKLVAKGQKAWEAAREAFLNAPAAFRQAAQ